MRGQRVGRWAAVSFFLGIGFTFVPEAARTQTPDEILPGPFAEPARAFPNAEGYGTASPAGRGGEIIRVTNLNQTGPGSFRAAIEAAGPRIVIFDVSGTIADTRDWIISSPFITIAGQTAPSPGITLRGAGLYVNTNDVLIQHLRVRVGDDRDGPNPGSRDGVRIQADARRVIIDHCSISWGVDGNLDVSGSRRTAPTDVTVSNCIISETLRNSIHPKGAHSRSVLLGRSSAIRGAFIKNLLMSSSQRHPDVQENAEWVLINNMSYNHERGAMAFSYSAGAMGPHRVSVIGNVGISGPSSRHRAQIRMDDRVQDDSEFYLADNVFERHADIGNNPSSILVDTPPFALPENLKLLRASDVESYLIANAGARPADRDPIDLRLIQELATRTGSIVNSPADVGGWPRLASNQRELILPTDPHGDRDGDGYTNLEAWLYLLASCVEGRAETDLDASQRKACELVLP